MKRKKKFVVWLNNSTDSRDDEWVVVYSHTRAYCKFLVYGKFDETRFSVGRVLTATEFKKKTGFGA